MSELSPLQSDPHSLLEAAAMGNQDAFQSVYHLYGLPMYRFVATMVDTKREAEALFKNLMVEVFDALPKYKGKSVPAHFFLLKALAAIRKYRKSGVLPGKPDKKVIEVILPHSHPEVARSNLQVNVRDLPQDQQEVLVLRFMNELPIKDIALLLNISETETRVRQAKGLKTLAKKLEELL